MAQDIDEGLDVKEHMAHFTYDDFVDKVNDFGFILPIDGFPSERDWIAEGQQWSGDPELDPWLWKDRVASEKRLAYVSLCKGKKGYIAPWFYATFRDAFHPSMIIEERYQSGKLGRYEWLLWELLGEQGRPLGTHEYRKLLGVSAGPERSALDTAVINLQLTFDIALVGNVPMLNKDGKPYNDAVGCDKVENWAPCEWLERPQMDRGEAFNTIIQRAHEVSGLGVDVIRKAFAKQVKLRDQFG